MSQSNHRPFAAGHLRANGALVLQVPKAFICDQCGLPGMGLKMKRHAGECKRAYLKAYDARRNKR